ncbi:MAG: hypothetical protein COA78_29950 [Blastopirellula sp.]|nr:MAG: hypothetical protein COA78_29950 [Blastopirellula sp.]
MTNDNPNSHFDSKSLNITEEMNKEIDSLNDEGFSIIAMKRLCEATGLDYKSASQYVLARKRSTIPCPFCGKDLCTVLAKQCLECGMDWHDPNNLRQL